MLVQWDRPESARFTDFDPFWEFVGGPINAGTFGPGEVDKTFGPDVKFVSIPNGMKQNRSPKEGLQFFGIGRIDARSRLAARRRRPAAVQGRVAAADLVPRR